MCLYGECHSQHTIYRTSKEWLSHMDTTHRSEIYRSESGYREHIPGPQAHDLAAPSSPDSIMMPARPNPVPTDCVFCDFTTNGSDDVHLHIAEHLKEFALSSLPWDVLRVADSAGLSESALDGAESRSLGSRLNQMEDFIDEETLGSNTSEGDEEWRNGTCDLAQIRTWPISDEHEMRLRIESWLSACYG